MNDLLENELINAVKSGNLTLVKTLIEEGGMDLTEALVVAAESGNLQIAGVLVEEGADPTNALAEAAYFGKLPAVKILVEKVGADPLDADVYNAANENENFDIIDYLVGRGTDFISDDDFDCYYAIDEGLFNIIKYCYDKSLQDNEAKKEYLLRIIGNGYLDVIKHIVENNNISDDDINDIFISATSSGQLDILKYLSTKKVINTNTLNNALLETFDLNIIKYLVEKGVDINTINEVMVGYDYDAANLNPNSRVGKYNYSKIYYLLSKGANFSLLSEHTKEKMRQMREEYIAKVLALAPELGVDLSRNIVGIETDYLFGKKYSKRVSKKRSKKRSKKHLRKRSKKSSFK